MASVTTAELYALLDHLTVPAIAAQLDDAANPPITWDDWTVSRATGSLNNRIYRATRHIASHASGPAPTGPDSADLAIKLTLRDRFIRAIREYHSLRVLERAGLAVGPRALLLEQDRYATPIVVLTWVSGEPCQTPPATDADWRALVQLFASIHTVSPERVPADLPSAVLMMRSAEEGLECVRTQLDMVPEADQPAEARALLARLEAHPFPTWNPPPASLCQGDGNFRNLLQRPGDWAAVDWEYSGWGDPVFEFSAIVAHAAYLDVPPERWAWACDLYLSLLPAAQRAASAERLAVYIPLMYGFWVARFARMLYEIPRGGDQRLTPYPDGWLEAVRGRYQRYLQLAHAALAQ